MNFLTPLTDEEKRRGRRMSGPLGNGEYISFDPLMCDAKPGSVFLTDSRKLDAISSQRAMRDTAQQLQYTGANHVMIGDAGSDGTGSAMTADASTMRDIARAAQYGG